jgi:death-on-curing protein
VRDHSKRQPRWLTRLVVDAIHHDQIREHGGLPGLRDEHALETALAGPQQKWNYSDRTDVAALAASYAFAISQHHPYNDGNKRIAFLALVTFLGINGYEFSATETDVVTEMVAWADDRVTEEALADWVRRHSSNARRS